MSSDSGFSVVSAELGIEFPVRVYIEDTDAGGIVYYVNYLKFMERARSELMRALGYGKAALFDDNLMMVVHSLNASYLASAGLDDELLVTAKVQKVGKVAVVFEQSVCRADQVLCHGTVKVACVRRSDQKPAAMPKALLDKLRAKSIV